MGPRELVTLGCLPCMCFYGEVQNINLYIHIYIYQNGWAITRPLDSTRGSRHLVNMHAMDMTLQLHKERSTGKPITVKRKME